MTSPDVARDLADLREATRQAHEAIQELKDLRQDLRRGLERTLAKFRDELHTRVDDLIKAEVTQGLDGYKESLNGAIDKATAAVYRRFDTIADILLGEDAAAKGEPLASYANKIAEVHRRRAGVIK